MFTDLAEFFSSSITEGSLEQDQLVTGVYRQIPAFRATHKWSFCFQVIDKIFIVAVSFGPNVKS